MKSSKKYITEYIILKILRSDYKTRDIISSENRLAIKFNCSRLTARSALISLVNIGVLESYRGMGYLVSKRALDIIFFSKSLKNLASLSEFEKIDKLSIFHPMIEFKKNECEIFIIRNLSPLNNIMSLSFIIIDKIVFDRFYNGNYKFDEINPIESIIDSSFIPSTTINNYILAEVRGYDDDLADLSYSSAEAVAILDQSLLDEENRVAVRTFNIVQKDKIIYSSFNKILPIKNKSFNE